MKGYRRMRTFAYACRPFDEISEFERCAREFGMEVKTAREALSIDNCSLAKGCDCVSVLTEPVSAEVLDSLKAAGVKMLGTRTVGFDHIDIEHAGKIGLKVFNSAYSSDSVAEFTVMLMLMCLRRCKSIIGRSAINDYSLKGLIGENLSGTNVGLVGTGAIGKRVAELLLGFGCGIFAYDKTPAEIEGVEYLSIEDLFRKSDIISLHVPLNDSTRHIINSGSIDSMKDGAVIVNTSRGGLIDTSALIGAMKAGKIAACGLDVLEEENGIFFHDFKSRVHGNSALSVLRDMPNAIITPHIAFYSRTSVSEMIRNCMLSFMLEGRGENSPFRIV